MSKTRTNIEASSFDEILSILEKGCCQESVWVGKNYSKADLIRDIKKLRPFGGHGIDFFIFDEVEKKL